MAALFWVPLALARELWTGETLLTRKLPLSHMFSKLAGTPSADWIALAKTNPEAVIGRVLELFGVLCAAGLIVTAVLALLALVQHARAFRRFFKWALLFSGALAIIMIALAALSGPALLPEQQMAFITSEAVGLAGSALGLIYLAVSRRARNTFGRRRARRDVRVRSSREPVMDHEPIHAS